MCFTPEAVDFECFQSVDTLYFYKTLTKYIYCVLYNLLTSLFCVSSHDDGLQYTALFLTKEKVLTNTHPRLCFVFVFSVEIFRLFFFLFLLIVCHLDIQ